MQLQTLLLTLAATFATALPSGPSSSGGGGGGGGNAGSCAGLNIFNDGSFAGTCNFATQLCTQKNGVTGKCDSCPCDGLGCFVDESPTGNIALCTETIIVGG